MLSIAVKLIPKDGDLLNPEESTRRKKYIRMKDSQTGWIEANSNILDLKKEVTWCPAKEHHRWKSSANCVKECGKEPILGLCPIVNRSVQKMSTKYDQLGPHVRDHRSPNNGPNVPEVKYEGLDYRISETNKKRVRMSFSNWNLRTWAEW
jgi:hypothetical protein